MSKTSRAVASLVDYGTAQDRTELLDDYTCSFVSIKADSDLTPLLKGLPDDRCQCPHWGYLFASQITVRYGDRVETIEPGDAFYMSPGHVPAAAAGSEFVQFSPTEALKITEQQMALNMQVAGM